MDETTDPGKRGRDRIRLMSRWRADMHIVETEQGELHVATCSGGALAAHIADLHNRTLGEGQDPPSRQRPILSTEGGWPLNASRAPRHDDHAHLPPSLRHWLGVADTSGYLTRINRLIEEEVQRRVTEYAARQPVRIKIDGDFDSMAGVLRIAGYRVDPPRTTDEPMLGLATTRQLLEELKTRGRVGRVARLADAAASLLGETDEPSLSEEALNDRTVD